MATNLQFIKSASGSAVNEFSITDCFSANYDVYKIYVVDYKQSHTTFPYLRFINSSGVDSSSNYDYAGLQLWANTTFSQNKNTNQNAMYDVIGYSDASESQGGINFDIFNAFDSSSYTFMKSQSATNSYQPAVGVKSIGVQKVAQQVTGFALGFGGGYTFTNITLKVFGVK
tara:strand:+ start:522 stop:1034 length:513 start_codon:yes stop_codon:yes gene_type:complete